MATIHSLLAALDERVIAREVALPHDETRMRYHLASNTVRSMGEFEQIISDYYAYHYSRCVSVGGRLPLSEARSTAKELIERAYRRRNGDIVAAFNDAHDGTNGGLRVVLDIIAEGLKSQSVERYIRDAFDRHVARNSWEQKVDMIRQFIAVCGIHLSPSIRYDQPERYARDYQELIHSYVQELKGTSSMFRRL